AFELLSGRPPFVGDTVTVLHAQVFDPPPPLRELRPGLPEGIYAAIDAALAKRAEERPASAGAFAALLRDALSAAPSPLPTAARPQDAEATLLMPPEPAHSQSVHAVNTEPNTPIVVPATPVPTSTPRYLPAYPVPPPSDTPAPAPRAGRGRRGLLVTIAVLVVALILGGGALAVA